MPRKSAFFHIKLPLVKPDSCEGCPFLGLIPENMRKKGSKKTLVCAATLHAISKAGSRVKVSEKDSTHPWHRPCDDKWELWETLPGRAVAIQNEAYLKFIEPWRRRQQIQIIFDDDDF